MKRSSQRHKAKRRLRKAWQDQDYVEYLGHPRSTWVRAKMARQDRDEQNRARTHSCQRPYCRRCRPKMVTNSP